jgi:hypothetical protein
MNGTLSRSKVDLLIIVMLALLGIAILRGATRWGIGTSPDSVAYIGAAASLQEGRGLSLPYGSTMGTPLTHHAPLYPVLLAAGATPLASAGWLNALLFGANILLVGSVVRSNTRGVLWMPILASLLVLTSVSLLTIHAFAWTEPLFLFVGFWGFFCLSEYLKRGELLSYGVSLVLLALACLTRYAALPMLATGVLGILLLDRKPLRPRLVRALLFGALGALPLGLWVLRNLAMAGTSANREVSLHLIGASHLWQLVYTVSGWLQLPNSAPDSLRFALLLLVGAGILAVGILRQRERSRGSEPPAERLHENVPFLRLLLIFVLLYIAFLVASISLVDANTPLDSRILAPVYVAGVFLFVYTLQELMRLLGEARWARVSAVVLISLFLLVSSFNAVTWLSTAWRDGLGFSSVAWRQSVTMDTVRALPEETSVFSNSPEAIYLLTGRPALALPKATSATAQQVNESYEADLERTRLRLERARGGVVVIFNGLESRSAVAQDELMDALSLYVVAEAADGVVYASNGTDN